VISGSGVCDRRERSLLNQGAVLVISGRGFCDIKERFL